MGRIKLLDEVLSNQIAAGEVVERPSSVVKELVENALDAGATQITVEIEDGGSRKIRVVDNGQGMGREDLELCIARHATSKLAAMEDLDTLRTLGFRGEALPSIASVSKMTVRTRQKDSIGALKLVIDGGKRSEMLEAPGPVGTEIVVNDLFFNVPARRKFLKKTATEASHVHEWVQRIALCYPQVALRFVRDHKTLADYPPTTDLRSRIGSVFGKKVASDLIPVMVPGQMGLDGFLGGGESARGTTRHYHLFINGRYVRDRVVMSAIQAGYGLSLPKGRHPFVVLRLTLPALLVDVNVHPAKTEVRFSDSRSVHRLVARAVDSVIRPIAQNIAPSTATYEAVAKGGHEAVSPRPIESQGPRSSGLDAHRSRIVAAMERIAVQRSGQSLGKATQGRPERPPPGPPTQTRFIDKTPASNSGRLPVLKQRTAVDESVSEVKAEAPERFVGMVGGVALYLSGESLLLVDRRRAVALMVYHRLQDSVGGTPLPRPLPLALSDRQAKTLEAASDDLTAWGFEVNTFSGGSYLLSRAPAGLDGDTACRWLCEYLDGRFTNERRPREWTMATLQSDASWQRYSAAELYQARVLPRLDGEAAILIKLDESALNEIIN